MMEEKSSQVTEDNRSTTGKPDKKCNEVKKPSRDQAIKQYVITTLRSMCGILSIWLLGWLGFSYSWVLCSFFLYLFWAHNKNERKKKFQLFREQNRSDQQMEFKYLPSWACFPDIERAEWINQMIKQMWPFISTMTSDILKNTVEPEIQKNLPSLLDSFHFEEVDLGNYPLRISGIKVYTEHVRPSEILIDADIVYAGDAIVKVGFDHGISAGISDLQLRGKVRIELNPLLSKPPLIGGVTVYFLELPEFDFDLTNLLNILDVPGLSDIFRKVLGEVIESFVVLPNRIKIPLGDPKDLEALKYPMPLGALHVNILSGKDLVARDKKFFKKDSSDPYVVAKVASYEHKTKTIEDSLNPKWEEESFMVFIDTLVGNKIRFDVLDSDPGIDDKMGHAEMDLTEIAHSSFKDSWLKLQGTSSGSIHVQCDWYNFTSNTKDLAKSKGKEKVSLFIKLDHAKNLPGIDMDKGTCSPYVEIIVAGKTINSKTQRNTKKPVWEELYSFFVKDVENDVIRIKVLDKRADDPLGTVNYKISDLLKEDGLSIFKSFTLDNCITEGELVATFILKALKSPDACTD